MTAAIIARYHEDGMVPSFFKIVVLLFNYPLIQFILCTTASAVGVQLGAEP